MKIFNRILVVALFSGLLGGLVLAGIQHFTVVPMITQAESFESDDGHHDHGHSHDHGGEEWAPEDGAERTFFTFTNSVIVGIGFGLLLTACYSVRKSVNWKKGILWGLAGFAAFHLAPAIGMLPKLPGDATAPLEQQQLWWVFTVVFTILGLWLIVFQAKPYMKLLGLVLLALPHIVGAPQPETQGGLAPEELRTAFQIASLTSNAIFWIILGAISGFLFNRLEQGSKVLTADAPAS